MRPTLNDVFYVRIDKNRKLPATLLLKALGAYKADKPHTWLSCIDNPVGGAVTGDALREIFGDDKRIVTTLERDTCISRDDCLLEIYKKLRPGDPPTVESSETLLENLFFDHRRYDISNVGRYKFNKKLALYPRVAGYALAEPVADPMTGEIIADAGETLSRERVRELEKKGVNAVRITVGENETVRVFSNGMVDAADFVRFSDDDAENRRIIKEELGLRERVRFILLRQYMEQYEGEELKEVLKENVDLLMPKHVICDDIFSAANYLSCLAHGIGEPDDIDHLGNRRVRSVGELLQNQFRIGFSRMERVIRERMTLQDLDIVTPQSLINIRPVTAAIKEFFGSSPLSPVHGSDEPAGRAYAQAPYLRARPRRPDPRARRLRRPRRSLQPLWPPLPDRDARRSEHRPYQLPVRLMPV